MIHGGERPCVTQGHLQFGEFAKQFIYVGQELVQGRIEQANRYGKAGHLTKDADKSSALQVQELFERFFARAGTVRENHLTHRRQTLIAKEHVFSATEAYAFSSHLSCHARIVRRVSIRAHGKTTETIGPLHQFIKIRTERRLYRRHFAEKYPAS